MAITPKIVFILGAGASYEAGGPLITDFLDVARRLRGANQVGGHNGEFDLVFKAIGKLQAVHSKACSVDINNVESVFAAFETAELLGRIEEYSSRGDSQGDELFGAMRAVIGSTVDTALKQARKLRSESARPAGPTGGAAMAAYPPYDKFAKLIHENQERAAISIITFNYDTCVEEELELAGLRIDHGLKDEVLGALPTLKLHGSLSWRRCSSCNDIFEKASQTMPGTDKVRHQPGCGELCLDTPVIIPPTWNKGARHRELRPVWIRAAKELKEADDIVVIGYSLPDSDDFFKQLYAIGTVSEKPLRRFTVIDPVGNVHARFKALLGPGSVGKYHPEKCSFSEALSHDALARYPW